MTDWAIEPERIITKFSEISDVVNAVQANMNEPSLIGKRIATHIISPQEFPQALERITRKTPLADKGMIDPENVDGVYVPDPLAPGFFYMFIKEKQFIEIFYAYFHELGHIATHDLPVRKRLSEKQDNVIICEMLADSFAGWAIEEYNAISPVPYPETPLRLLAEETKLMRMAETLHLSTQATRTANASMLHLYVSNQMRYFKQLYRFIYGRAAGGEPLDLLRIK